MKKTSIIRILKYTALSIFLLSFVFIEISIFTNYFDLKIDTMILERMEIFLFAILSSGIFYFFLIKLKRVEDEDNIKPYIAQKVGGIIHIYNEQLRNLKLISPLEWMVSLNVEIKGGLKNVDEKNRKIIKEKIRQIKKSNFFPNEDKIKEVFEKIKPNELSPMAVGNQKLNFLQYLYQEAMWIDKLLKEIIKISPIIDTELIKIISEIENHYYIKEITLFSIYGVGNRNLLFMARFFFLFQNEMIKLNDYFEKNLRIYYKNQPARASHPIINNNPS